MHHAVRDDRLWFQRHPQAIVRFRPSAAGEFAPLEHKKEDPPIFRPSCSDCTSPLNWVAVVDLMQLLGTKARDQPSAPTARLRLRTPALSNHFDRERAQQELIEAIAAELLEQAESTAAPSPERQADTPIRAENEDTRDWIAA